MGTDTRTQASVISESKNQLCMGLLLFDGNGPFTFYRWAALREF